MNPQTGTRSGVFPAARAREAIDSDDDVQAGLAAAAKSRQYAQAHPLCTNKERRASHYIYTKES